ncbi:MAG TPA: extracellular solute-binding protein [Acholeplasmataceae bacterium]|jgi:ABC-type glycerol-3-phosphate transport system substrate-binding protein|nr:extracellular solute-binding protein [Acholeplasmataceae bacterium]
MKKSLFLLLITFFSLSTVLFFSSQYHPYAEAENNIPKNTPNNLLNNEGESNYSSFLNTYESAWANIDVLKYSIPDILSDTSLLKEPLLSYETSVLELENKQSADLILDIPTAGLYNIYIDYYFASFQTGDSEGFLLINDEYQYYEARQIAFRGNWKPTTNEFKKDRYQNEIVPSSKKTDKWYRYSDGYGMIYDGSRLHQGTLACYFKKGLNKITLGLNTGKMQFGKITLTGKKQLLNYQEYLASIPKDTPKFDQLITFEPEYISLKNDVAIRIASERDPSAAPNYHTTKRLLNVVAHDAWNKGGQAITWEIEVPKTGLYNIGFKYIQYGMLDMPTFRSILVNGEMPFKELLNYPFMYTKRWKNEVLHNDEEEFYFYLTEGKNTLTLVCSLEPYRFIIEEIARITKEMQNLSLEIKRLTGGKADQYRDWVITKYLPNIESDLITWSDEIQNIIEYGNTFSDKKNGSSEFSLLKMATKKLKKLAEEPNQLPNRLTQFTDGEASVAEYLGNTMLKFYQNPLGLEKIYLLGQGAKLPRPRANIFVRIWEGIKRFFLSFFNEEYAVTKVEDDEIEVWVRRSRQYIEIMQKMVDDAGLKVKFSIMPDENKLVLANASNDLPDVAMGISNWIPYDLAIRGMTVDLRAFDGFDEMVSTMTKGAIIPYVYDKGVYGIPETQDFWVLFYRKDLITDQGIKVPSTWDDVVGILPQLQRLGLNFYEPLSSFTGLKPFVATLPFLYQFGENLYAEDGMSTTLDSEANITALKFMTNLFIIYNIPQEVTNFYNSFRYGTLPIGIANSATYLQLLVAAPEIQGNWDLALHPGVETDNGEILRYAPAGSQGITMFKQSKKQQQAFEFVKWWMSTEVQTEFIVALQSMYGEEYMWFSANNEAFRNLPIKQAHKEVIEAQWEWAVEASRIPAAYMVERSISDAFSKIVFNGANPRIALSDAVIEANREIARKMEEFGYMKNGKKVKDYLVPTIYNIDEWLKQKE